MSWATYFVSTAVITFPRFGSLLPKPSSFFRNIPKFLFQMWSVHNILWYNNFIYFVRLNEGWLWTVETFFTLTHAIFPLSFFFLLNRLNETHFFPVRDINGSKFASCFPPDIHRNQSALMSYNVDRWRGMHESIIAKVQSLFQPPLLGKTFVPTDLQVAVYKGEKKNISAKKKKKRKKKKQEF